MLFVIVTVALAGILSVESTESTDCAQPPTFPYAKLETTSTTHGSYAFYSFQEPLLGHQRVQCLNGEWINMPICNNTDCAEPPTIPFTKLEKTSTTNGSYAFYSFQDPYKLMGHQRVQCLNGEWINKPTCIDSDGNTLPQHKNTHTVDTLDRDCIDLLRKGHRRSGVYTIYPTLGKEKSLEVYCDMETDRGGWTVIQRRGDFQNPVDYFYKDWKSYKEGFGDLEKEFWLGNDNIFAITNQENYSARFDLVDSTGNTKYAHYDEFRIDDEDSKYRLHISNYRGDAGDSMTAHNNGKFSTRDQDNDENSSYQCAQTYVGAWWYTGNCYRAYLNGENLKGYVQNYRGKFWYDWKGWKESLAGTEIKIRPKNLRECI